MERELESPSSFKDVIGIVSIVSILKHGILMVGKSGQKKQKINLWNLLIDHISDVSRFLVENV